MDLIEIELYALPSGKEPYVEWELKLSKDTQAIMGARLARLRNGNFGDSKSIGNGVYELRIQYGPGYRIYYGKKGKKNCHFVIPKELQKLEFWQGSGTNFYVCSERPLCEHKARVKTKNLLPS